MKLTGFGLYCGLLLSINAFSIDILLPAFASIEADLSASLRQVQLIVPVYMIAVGLGNPLFGLWSDRVGRKPVLIGGLLLFSLGSLVCVYSTTIVTLLSGRFLQGFAAAAAMVICRAMMRDRFSGVALAQNMAIASMFFAIGPMLAPLVGYLVYSAFGWRAVFWSLVLFGFIMLVATLRQPETLAAGRRSHGPGSVVADFMAVYQNPQSLHFIVLSCFCSSMIFSFLAYAPEIYTGHLGATSGQFSVLFAVSSFGIIFGQWLNHRLMASHGTVATSCYAAGLLFVVTVLLLISVVTSLLNVYFLAVLMLTFNLFYLVVFSNFLSLCLDPHASRAGTAAAMYGFTSYIGGALLSILIGFFAGEDITRWAMCFSLLALIIFTGARRWLKNGTVAG